MPEAGALTIEPGSLAGHTYVLTWKTSADDVNSGGSFVDFADIAVPCGAWPVLGEHGLAEWILLGLPQRGTEAGPREAQLQAADS